MIKEILKWCIFPGLNLHARQRYRLVPGLWGPVAGKRVLDAGFGNGMLSYRLYRDGATVLGCSIKENEVASCRRMFHGLLHLNEKRIKFENANLYEVETIVSEHGQFDMVVCCDVIEHIFDDKAICQSFFDLLVPGGTLLLTTPHLEHPYNRSFPLDREEKGGHVRPGYNDKSFRELLEPIGFQIDSIGGFGGPVRQYFDDKIKVVQDRFGAYAGIPLFLVALPLISFDSHPPSVPFSIYCKAIKPL